MARGNGPRQRSLRGRGNDERGRGNRVAGVVIVVDVVAVADVVVCRCCCYCCCCCDAAHPPGKLVTSIRVPHASSPRRISLNETGRAALHCC